MRVRQAATSDLEPLVGLAAALFAEDAGARDPEVDLDWPTTEQGRSYYTGLLAEDRALVLLAEDDGAVVGFLIGRLRGVDPLRPRASEAELESMFVTSRKRLRGAGRTLAEHFQRWASTQGATVTVVAAYAANTSAVSFYRTLGYDEHKVLFHRPLTPVQETPRIDPTGAGGPRRSGRSGARSVRGG